MSASNSLPRSLSPDRRRWEKVWNTYVRLPLPWMFRPFQHKHWEMQTIGDGHGPDKFVELTVLSEVLLNHVEQMAQDKGAAILDLGCNVGRHLNALWRKGYSNLHGIDVQHAALDYMGELFPEMKSASVIRQGTFQEYFQSIGNAHFEVVFTHGATIELVPPSFPVCQEMARISGKAVVLAINESDHSYPRLWEREFLNAGFIMTKLMRPAHPEFLSTLMVFLRMNTSK